MKREIRMAGYDPAACDGVNNDFPTSGDASSDCRDPWDNDPDEGCDDLDESAHNKPAPIGFVKAEEGEIRFTADLSYDPDLADGYAPNVSGLHEDLEYKLHASEPLLLRNDQTVAYDIEAVAFAYAVDDDLDGELDLTPNGHIQWIFDSNDGDNTLDQWVETVDDGVIDTADDEGGQNKGGPQVAANRIRAVRIWLLACTRQPIKGHTDNRTYAVGPLRRGPADGNWDPRRKRVLLTATVYCRNM